jgi:hypothetical protein
MTKMLPVAVLIAGAVVRASSAPQGTLELKSTPPGAGVVGTI